MASSRRHYFNCFKYFMRAFWQANALRICHGLDCCDCVASCKHFIPHQADYWFDEARHVTYLCFFLNNVIPIDYTQLRGDNWWCMYTQIQVWQNAKSTFRLFHLQTIDRIFYCVTQKMYSNSRVCDPLLRVQVMGNTQFAAQFLAWVQ